MNYHIVFNNSYCLGFIEDVLTLKEEANNEFWFRGEDDGSVRNLGQLSFSFLGKNLNELDKKLLVLKKEDNLFVHYYDIVTARHIMNLPNKIIAFHWGGDFFQDPYWYHINWVFDRLTKKYVIDHEREKFIWRKNIFKMWEQLKRIYTLPRQLYKEKNIQMGKIDCVLCNEFNTADLEKAKLLFPNFNAEHLPASYNLKFDEALKLAEDYTVEREVSSNSKLKILLGNSATPANNHLDAFEVLSKLENIEIHCVLAYGDEKYGANIIKQGKRIFKDSFIPILEMKESEDYITFLNSMDLIFMFHNRSQGWGNISQCLTIGKPVFLKETNSLKDYISCMGIKTYDAENIETYDFDFIISEEKKAAKINREIFRETFSNLARLNCLDKILKEHSK